MQVHTVRFEGRDGDDTTVFATEALSYAHLQSVTLTLLAQDEYRQDFMEAMTEDVPMNDYVEAYWDDEVEGGSTHTEFMWHETHSVEGVGTNNKKQPTKWTADDVAPSNFDRSERARAALEAATAARGDVWDEPESEVADLLTDLRHYAVQHNLDWPGLLQTGDINFHAEFLEQTTAAAPASPGYLYELIREDVAGELLGLSIRTLQAWRQDKKGPPYIRVSNKAIRYRRTDLNEWVESRLEKGGPTDA